MQEIFSKIWDSALSYQDKRDDEGHAEFVLETAFGLINLENVDKDIVIPAAILHDIGWSKVPKEEAMNNFGNKLSDKDKIELRKKHEIIGVEMAKEVLEKANYPSNKTEEILEIISGHDTRKGFVSRNDGITRDADKLWRYSKKGFWLDIKRGNYTPEGRYQMLKEKIDLLNFFYSESAKKIAREELEKRKLEFKEEK